MLRFILGFVFVMAGLPAWADPVLNSATLPNARVVPLSATATIFMTTLNSGDMNANNCTVVPTIQIGNADISKIDINWTLTDGAGGLIGNQNDPFAIAAGGAAQLVLSIQRNASALSFNTNFTPIFHVECEGGFGSRGWPAVNGAHIRFSDTLPDIIPIIQTFTADGIANVDGSNRFAVISVAAINNTALSVATSTKGTSGPQAGETPIGIGGSYSGYRNAGQFDYLACETDASGACTSELTSCSPSSFQPCFTTVIGDTPKTFSYFLEVPPGQGAPFQPEFFRFQTTFHDQFNTANASTSVALDGPAPLHPGGRPLGPYEVTFRNNADLGARTLRGGAMIVGENDVGGILYRSIDRGSFIQIVEQHFVADGDFFEVGGTNACSDATPCETEMHGDLTCTFYDTGLGASSDGAQNDCACTIQPDEGGICDMPDALGEQIVGETDLFDALEASQFLMGNDFSSRISFVEYNKKEWQTASLDGFNFNETVLVGANGQSEFNLEGCTINLEFPGGPASQVLGALFTIKNCDNASRIKALEGTSILAHLYVTRNADGSCIYQFVMPIDHNDPNAGSFTFFIKTGVPSGADQPIPSASSVISISPRMKMATTLANQYNKPVYWHINGRDVLVAEPAGNH